MSLAQLILIRHAKSADGQVDLDRPLSSRGLADAAAVGQLLAGAGIAPDRVLLSPALRARQTWASVQDGLPVPAPLAVEPRIYDNDVTLLYEVIHETPGAVRSLVLVGHNPSFEALANSLDDGVGDDDARRQLHAGYPTSAVAIFELSCSWAELRPETATLRTLAVPRG